VTKKDEGKKESQTEDHRPGRPHHDTPCGLEIPKKKAFEKLQAGWIVGEKGLELAVCQELHLTE
jgi:hypothetical protein